MLFIRDGILDFIQLDLIQPYENVLKNGINLDEFALLAKCNGLDTELYRPGTTTKELFLENIKRITQRSDEYLAVSYDRGTLQQTGIGHYSPIGGYNPENNMVLILDVARFKYPSYWVSVDLLW